MKSRLLYIERKAGQLTGEAQIGRVTYSKSGLKILYKGKAFRSLKGRGFKANYYDVESGAEYWISGPRRDGADRLYGERLPTAIDPDVWDEYWTAIRGQTPPAFVTVPAETEHTYKNGVFKEGVRSRNGKYRPLRRFRAGAESSGTMQKFVICF